MVCQLIDNCLKYWIFSLMTRLPSSMPCQAGKIYLMRLFGKREFVSPISRPQGLWSSWRVTMTIRRWKVFYSDIVAIWHVLTSGANVPFVWLLGFPLNFSFLCLVFKLPFFPLSPSLFPTLSQSLLCAFSSPICSTLRFSLSFCILWLLPLWYVSLFPFLFDFLWHR